MGDIYRTIQNTSEGIFKDKGSKFLAFAFPVSNEDEIKKILTGIKKKYHDARHHCFAYQIGIENVLLRVNDDNEPSGTAGKPIYGQIQSFCLTNVLIVVVRYFGGVLLGTGGLTNAYKSAAFEALKNATIIEKTIEECVHVLFDYNHTKDVNRIINQFNGTISRQLFDEKCKFDVLIRKSQTSAFLDKISKIPNLTFTLYKNSE